MHMSTVLLCGSPASFEPLFLLAGSACLACSLPFVTLCLLQGWTQESCIVSHFSGRAEFMLSLLESSLVAYGKCTIHTTLWFPPSRNLPTLVQRDMRRMSKAVLLMPVKHKR